MPEDPESSFRSSSSDVNLSPYWTDIKDQAAKAAKEAEVQRAKKAKEIVRKGKEAKLFRWASEEYFKTLFLCSSWYHDQ